MKCRCIFQIPKTPCSNPAAGGIFHTYHPFAFAKYAIFMYGNPYIKTDVLTAIETSMCIQPSGEERCRAT
ncbi:MAG: hypothetical protein Q7J10_09400, partial [Methanosarcinaceae archaeon]|nr:hypothetical protein [Methanosarcinaceae archaeon]